MAICTTDNHLWYVYHVPGEKIGITTRDVLERLKEQKLHKKPYAIIDTVYGTKKDATAVETKWQRHYDLIDGNIKKNTDPEFIEKIRKPKSTTAAYHAYWANETNRIERGKRMKETCRRGEDHQNFGVPAFNRKRVLQYDMQWNLVKEWDCAADAENAFCGNKKGDRVAACCRREGKLLGYYFRYETQ